MLQIRSVLCSCVDGWRVCEVLYTCQGRRNACRNIPICSLIVRTKKKSRSLIVIGIKYIYLFNFHT